MSTGALRGKLLADLLVKAVLIGVLALAAAEPGWSQFHGKAIVARMITYPLVALLVPALWWIRGRIRPYPYLIDALLVAPFTIDSLGNAANLYDTIRWWDDANHFVNWALLVAAICLALERHGLTGGVNAAVGVGMGAVAAILWELAEYVTFMRHSGELRTAYTDTLGDLSLGLLGSALAAGTMRAIRVVRR